MRQVGLDEVARVDPATQVGVADAAELALAPDELLELLLERVVELEAVGVEDLEAVVVGRIVRGRDHDPGGERAGPGQVREGRGRHDADDVDVDARGSSPRP